MKILINTIWEWLKKKVFSLDELISKFYLIHLLVILDKW